MAKLHKSRDWMLDKDTSVIYCFESSESNQIAAKFIEASSSTPFHDSDLVQATKELNEIVDGLKRDNPNRELAFLNFGDGLFLAWTTSNTVSSKDSESVIKQTLKLK